MFFYFLFECTSISSLSAVFQGNWSGRSISSTKNSDFKDFFASVIKVEDYLELNCMDHKSIIRISGEELSGNFTFNENTYFFNFTKFSPPFISTEVIINNIKVRISFASNKVIKMILLYEDGNVDTLVLNKISETKESELAEKLPVILSWAALISLPIVVFVLIKNRIEKESNSDFAEEEEKAENAKEKEEEDVIEENNKEEEEEHSVEPKEKSDDGIVHRK